MASVDCNRANDCDSWATAGRNWSLFLECRGSLHVLDLAARERVGGIGLFCGTSTDKMSNPERDQSLKDVIETCS